MRATVRWLALVVLAAVGIAVNVYLLTAKSPPVPAAEATPPLPEVQVIEVSPASRRLRVQTQGTVQPRRRIDVVAEVSGVVREVAETFTEGGFLRRGGLLVKLEADDYRFALLRTKAAVAKARQELAQEQGLVRQAKREWRDLRDRDANALFLRQPQLASAQAALLAAAADVDLAQLNLARTEVVAPFDARIVETFVDVGQFVAQGAPIARLFATDAVEVRLPLSTREAGLLDLDLFYPAQAGSAPVDFPVTLSGRFGGRLWHWQAHIRRTDAGIDPSSRVLFIVAEVLEPFVPNPEQLERPPLLFGQFVEAEIVGRETEDVLVLPREALRPRSTIWVIDSADRLEIRQVEVAQFGDIEVAVTGAFEPQMRVIVSPLHRVIPGLQVRPMRAEHHRDGN